MDFTSDQTRNSGVTHDELRFSTLSRKGLETWIRLINCRSLAEVACVQFEANAEFASDYLDRVARNISASTHSREPSR